MALTRQKPRWLRRLSLVLLLLLSPWILYVGLGNAFLNVGGVRWMLGATREVSIDYRRAWTVWPGRVHLSGLHFTFQDQNVQFAIDLERASLSLSLLELPSRTFHATKLRGEGTSFRMRHRIEPHAAEKPWARALAPIPEFSDPPLFESVVPTPPVPEAQYRLWTIHMEDVDVGVSELWVQFIRYRGQARASGAFRLRPGRHLWVGPAALEFARGDVTLGRDELLGDLQGRIACVVHPFDVRVPTGLAVMRHITSQIALRGKRLRVDALPRWFSREPELELYLAPGELELALDVQHGRGRPGSRLTLASESVRVREPGGELVARGLSAQSRVADDGHAETELRLDEGELLLAKQRRASPARFRGFVLGARLANADAADPPASADRKLEVKSIRLADARWLNGLIKVPGFALLGGTVAGRLALEERRARTSGTAALELAGVSARAGALGLSGDGRFELSLDGANPSTLTGRLRVAGKLSRLRARLQSDEQASVEASVTQLRVQGSASRSRPGELEASLHAESALARGTAKQLWFRARPALDLSLRGERADQRMRAKLELADVALGSSGKDTDCPWLKSPEAGVELERNADSLQIVARVRRLNLGWGDFRLQTDSEARARVAFARDETRAAGVSFSLQNQRVHLQSGQGGSDGWEVSLPKVAWHGELSLSEKHPGYAELAETRLSGRVGGARVNTRLSAHFQLAELDLSRKHSRFAANVSVGPAALEASGQQVDDWWARVMLGSGLVTLGANLDASALFQAELRDAAPGLLLLAEQGEVPGFIAHNLPLEELSVTGIVQRRCRLTDFLITRASGGPLSVRGRLHSTTDSTRAALLLRLNGLEAISAGLAVDPQGTDISLFAGDDWLREHKEKLDEKAREILESPCVQPPSACEDTQ